MRVFTAGLGTETNTFSPMPTGIEDFRAHGHYHAGQHPPEISNYAGPMFAAREHARDAGWTLIEGMVTGAQPGGTTTRETWEQLRDELLTDLRNAMPVDMVLLGLHGAMVADGVDDCEGELLRCVREVVGPRVVIGAELDPHAHLSQTMVDQANVLVAYKEYPHTDIYPRAKELVDLCARTAAGAIHPVAAIADTGMVVPMHTTREPARGFVDRLMAMEGHDGVLSISAIQGFATGDVPDMGCKMLVYKDADAAGAARLARELADELVAMRDALRVHYLDVDAALDEALASSEHPVILADRSDNPGSGAAGDSTFLLRRLIERGIEDATLGPLWDPVAVQIAFTAGVGARLKMRIGGKISPMSGDPVDADCHVKALVRGHTMTGLAGNPTSVGDSALVDVGGVECVLISWRAQALNVDLFAGLGCDLASRRIIVVKSAQHFYASFSQVSKRVLYVGAPGSATPRWHELPYRKVSLPKWPIG
ncbi:M81 family metallopeptidase [Paraburkholderia phosphatilytica]|uniref:M81 family metallopeptidase n=1 Tax=Paraburkholderia phosphatilytica TaxID=2282883 RepID=UPI000E507114|nr:M81 family metallopeptidase [Paraburkholderia phosphatilytica]